MAADEMLTMGSRVGDSDAEAILHVAVAISAPAAVVSVVDVD